MLNFLLEVHCAILNFIGWLKRRYMYHFANLVPCKDLSEGFEPDLPDYVTGFISVSPNNPDCKWCLCDSEIDLDYEGDFAALEVVSNELDVLLFSAKAYPPALAISLSEANSICPITKNEYQALLASLIKKNLRHQASSNYILCEVLIGQVGYLTKGEFVWIISYEAEKETVQWVSDDFYIYSDHISNFDISRELLNRL